MTSDEQLDRRQLEAATSRSLPSAVTLDAETSTLRDGFMVLGQAALAAGTDFDEAALLARVQASCLNDVASPRPRKISTAGWTLLLSGALAAAALVAMARIAGSWPDHEQVVVAPPSPELDEVDSATASFDASLPAWDDPLDDEIAAAESSLSDLSGRWTGIDGSLSNMNQSLESLSDDLSDGSL
jgi:hypothetical protein